MLALSLLLDTYAVCQLPADEPFPDWARGDELIALARTPEEVSVVCEARFVPVGVKSEGGWRAFKVAGPLDFSLVGILANLAGVLADAAVSIFAISTYDTDYVLVREENLEQAIRSLREAGVDITNLPPHMASATLTTKEP